MKRNFLLGSCLLLAGVLSAAADTKDTVISAAHKLADSSYTYTSTPKNTGGGAGKGFQQGPTDGQVEKGGLVRLSRTTGQFTSESFIKGEKAVTKTPDGWKTVDELLEAAKQGGGGGGKGGKGKGGFAAIAGLRGYKTPAEQAADLAEKAKELKESDGAIVGDLPESAAKELVTPGGRGGKGPGIEGAKGSVKFWIKDGALSKFEYSVQGKVSFGGNEINIDRTIEIEVKDVGSVKITIPDEVKSKLE